MLAIEVTTLSGEDIMLLEVFVHSDKVTVFSCEATVLLGEVSISADEVTVLSGKFAILYEVTNLHYFTAMLSPSFSLQEVIFRICQVRYLSYLVSCPQTTSLAAQEL